jgi:hypothetical protein
MRTIKINYWIELIDMLIYYVDKNFQDELLDWINNMLIFFIKIIEMNY